MTENETVYNSEFLSKFDKEFKNLEDEKKSLLWDILKFNFQKIERKRIMQQNRKTEAIELLNFLIEQYKTNSNIEDIRLGQLLLNVVPNESLLYHLESKDIHQRISNFLKK